VKEFCFGVPLLDVGDPCALIFPYVMLIGGKLYTFLDNVKLEDGEKCSVLHDLPVGEKTSAPCSKT
jgi:hypothetical protein